MIEISSKTIARLPAIQEMVNTWQQMAMCEAILEADANWRVFDFDSQWSEHVSLGRIDTRQGDCIAAVFSGQDGFIHGYNERTALQWPASAPVITTADRSGVPSILQHYLDNPAMDCGGYTFRISRAAGDSCWSPIATMLADPTIADCPIDFLSLLCGRQDDFREWILEYYVEMSMPEALTSLIARLYGREPLLPQLVAGIDLQGRSFSTLVDAARRIGYPIG